MTGTTPPGTSNPWQASRWVRQMFGGIAPKYDLLNHLLSFNVDRSWRKRLKLHLRPVLEQKDARVIDLCCGTGDVLLALRAVASAQIFGADFCHPMLIAAQAKGVQRLMECDALELPLADNSADALTIAFGFRNLADYEAGLVEFRRVLKPGGMLAILEFSHPRGRLFRTAFGVYSNLLLPAIGAAISGSREAYRYLPESVRKFPGAEKLAAMMTAAGFANVSFELLTGGIAALHVGSK